jgi:hypothetical protein
VIGRYFWNLLQALDRLVNTVFGGTDKEYISSRVFRYKDDNKVAWAAYKMLNAIDKDHCEKAFMDAQVGFDPNDAVWK